MRTLFGIRVIEGDPDCEHEAVDLQDKFTPAFHRINCAKCNASLGAVIYPEGFL